jgi:hypothetical protein
MVLHRFSHVSFGIVDCSKSAGISMQSAQFLILFDGIVIKGRLDRGY